MRRIMLRGRLIVAQELSSKYRSCKSIHQYILKLENSVIFSREYPQICRMLEVLQQMRYELCWYLLVGRRFEMAKL
jgi:hypothetical protein